MEKCLLCQPFGLEDQEIVFENKTCLYIQSPQNQTILEGSGLIIPKAHRPSVFDLTQEEWNDTYSLLAFANAYLDRTLKPDGYNIGWNSGEIGGQHILHAHLHVIPRFSDEPYAGRGIRSWLKSPFNKRPQNV
ncbi:HIT family protein [Fictibacillus sp. KU28468]|uniref:HIT family protein n=1 Tax=Fictibacillus sp. KU28468 TaxID=2991053 RepID=UPI00223CF5C7|nr:HIT domain-containing protein [Fictibacillus sp. KU28468]UZJ78152.1 HIT domain-containing protein [Fictibacillus sp. KU28468]